MSNAIRIRRDENRLPPAVIFSCLISCYAVGLWGYLLYLLCSTLLAWQIPLAFCCAAVLLLSFWSFAGLIIETGLIVSLVRHSRIENYFAAEREYIRFTQLWRALPIRQGGRLGLTYSNLSLVLMSQGKYEQAEPVLREAVRLVEQDRRLKHSYLMAIALNNLAAVLCHAKKFEESETLSKRALFIFEQKSGSTCGSAFALLNLGSICVQTDRFAESEQHLERARLFLENTRKPFLVMPSSVEQAKVSVVLSYALLRCEQGRMDEARSLCDTLLAEKNSRYLRSTALEKMSLISRRLIDAGDKATAEKVLEHAYMIGQKQPQHLHTEEMLDTYALLLTQTNRADEIADMRRWIRPVMLPAVI